MEEYVKSKLMQLSDKKYRDFSAKLIPNINNVLGVRLPALRKLAKELYRCKEFSVNEFILLKDDTYMELTMLQGLLIGLKKSTKEEFLYDISNYVPKINNWAVCDTFCNSLKLTNKYLSETFEFLQSYITSKDAYKLRFGVVMLLTYYITDDYIDRVLKILTNLSSKDYYAQMGIAWALSMCYVNYFDKTHKAVAASKLSKEIQKRTVRKVIESLRPSNAQKDFLRQYLNTFKD